MYCALRHVSQAFSNMSLFSIESPTDEGQEPGPVCDRRANVLIRCVWVAGFVYDSGNTMSQEGQYNQYIYIYIIL